MKRFKRFANLAALVSISLAAVGCGSNNNNPQPGLGGPGVPGYIGPVGPGGIIPGGVAAINGPIAFSGNNVYYYGKRLAGATPVWEKNSTVGPAPFGYPYVNGQPHPLNTMVLGNTVSISTGQPNVLTGTSRMPEAAGSTLSLLFNGGANPWQTNVNGVLYISPTAAQLIASQGWGSQVLGIAVDVIRYDMPSLPMAGNVYLCMRQNQYGACEGPRIEF